MKKSDNWNRFVREGLLVGEESNVKFTFKKMSKKFGLCYINYVKAAWEANAGCFTEEEFCVINGNVPQGFFDKKVKGDH